jgi:hypothetical protein
MTWVAEYAVANKPMQVFKCESCDKYAAALAVTNGAQTGAAPGAVTGL